MDVLLIRHAVAEQRDPGRWPDDALRPLTAPGKRRFREAVAGLARIVPRPAVVLTSPYERAQATAAILEKAAAWPAAVACDALCPGATAADVIAVMRGMPEAECVAVVGHEPGLSRLLTCLLAGSEEAMAVEFRKGGAALVTFQGEPAAGQGRLCMLLTPRVLRRLGR